MGSKINITGILDNYISTWCKVEVEGEEDVYTQKSNIDFIIPSGATTNIKVFIRGKYYLVDSFADLKFQGRAPANRDEFDHAISEGFYFI